MRELDGTQAHTEVICLDSLRRTSRAGIDRLLDGRNRLEAMERSGVPFEVDLVDPRIEVEDSIFGLTTVSTKVYAAGGGARVIADPYEYVLSANVHRRHLSAAQKREVVAKILKAQPEKSDRQIAKAANVSPTTVGKERAKLEQTGAVSKLDTRTDARGRKQQATKPKRDTQNDLEPSQLDQDAPRPPVHRLVARLERIAAELGGASLTRTDVADLAKAVTDVQRAVKDAARPAIDERRRSAAGKKAARTRAKKKG